MSQLLWYPGHDPVLTDIVRGEGCRLFDAAGRSWLDLESGVWCTSVGHGHPRLLKVLADQASRLSHAGFNYGCPVVEEAAGGILDLLGLAGGRVAFLCSGSEAVEYCVRAAQTTARRPLTLTLSDSYFGAYGQASLRPADQWAHFDWFGCADCPADRSCDRTCERWRTIPFERVDAFLLEPGSSSGLVRFPPRKLIAAVVERVRTGGGVVLVNEVTTGIGRTGEWFGHTHYGFVPDGAALGKGLGGGYPVAAAALGPRLAERLGGQPLKYAQSHQNDPLGAAMAREVLAIIRDEGLLANAREQGAWLGERLDELATACDRVTAVRHRGLMAAIDLRDDATGTFTTRVHRALIERGILVGKRPGLATLRLDPPLVIRRPDLEELAAALGEVLTG